MSHQIYDEILVNFVIKKNVLLISDQAVPRPQSKLFK